MIYKKKLIKAKSLKAFGGKPFITIPKNAIVGDSSDSDKGKVLDLSFLNIDIVQTAYIQSLMSGPAS